MYRLLEVRQDKNLVYTCLYCYLSVLTILHYAQVIKIQETKTSESEARQNTVINYACATYLTYNYDTHVLTATSVQLQYYITHLINEKARANIKRGTR